MKKEGEAFRQARMQAARPCQYRKKPIGVVLRPTRIRGGGRSCGPSPNFALHGSLLLPSVSASAALSGVPLAARRCTGRQQLSAELGTGAVPFWHRRPLFWPTFHRLFRKLLLSSGDVSRHSPVYWVGDHPLVWARLGSRDAPDQANSHQINGFAPGGYAEYAPPTFIFSLNFYP
jgi:hypothetical protein